MLRVSDSSSSLLHALSDRGQAKLREKSGSPSNQASDQPIPTIAVTAIKARSIGLQDQVGRAELDRSRSY